MVANMIYSDRLNATWVKYHLMAFNPGGIYQGNLLFWWPINLKKNIG